MCLYLSAFACESVMAAYVYVHACVCMLLHVHMCMHVCIAAGAHVGMLAHVCVQAC